VRTPRDCNFGARCTKRAAGKCRFLHPQDGSDADFQHRGRRAGGRPCRFGDVRVCV
jgi:hypothetical protein